MGKGDIDGIGCIMEELKRKTEKYCHAKVFAEVFYEEIKKVETEELYEKVETCLKNFMRSERYDWLVEEAVQNKEDWIITRRARQYVARDHP